MKRRVAVGLFLVLALVALVLAPGAAQAGLIEATATLTALGNTFPITSNTTIFTGTETVSGAVEFSGVIGDAGASWELDLTATGFTISTNCINFFGNDCDYPNGLTLSLTNLSFSPLATLVDLTIVPVFPPGGDPLLVSGTPLVTGSSVTINFLAFERGSENEAGELETVFEAQFVTEPVVVATPLPGALLLVALGGLGAAALAIYRARA